jgi:hypothetical protein
MAEPATKTEEFRRNARREVALLGAVESFMKFAPESGPQWDEWRDTKGAAHAESPLALG